MNFYNKNFRIVFLCLPHNQGCGMSNFLEHNVLFDKNKNLYNIQSAVISQKIIEYHALCQSMCEVDYGMHILLDW